MSEPSPTYTMQGGQAVFCATCANRVGSIVIIQDQEWFRTGGLVVRTLHGVCGVCGSEFHWSASDRMLSELIRKVLELRAYP